jgi:hypothetical protein
MLIDLEIHYRVNIDLSIGLIKIEFGNNGFQAPNI